MPTSETPSSQNSTEKLADKTIDSQQLIKVIANDSPLAAEIFKQMTKGEEPKDPNITDQD